MTMRVVAELASVVVPHQTVVAKCYALQAELAKLKAALRRVANAPQYALPFLQVGPVGVRVRVSVCRSSPSTQPGRVVVGVVDGDDRYGLGVVITFHSKIETGTNKSASCLLARARRRRS